MMFKQNNSDSKKPNKKRQYANLKNINLLKQLKKDTFKESSINRRNNSQQRSKSTTFNKKGNFHSNMQQHQQSIDQSKPSRKSTCHNFGSDPNTQQMINIVANPKFSRQSVIEHGNKENIR